MVSCIDLCGDMLCNHMPVFKWIPRIHNGCCDALARKAVRDKEVFITVDGLSEEVRLAFH
jgi:hypothetical protein